MAGMPGEVRRDRNGPGDGVRPSSPGQFAGIGMVLSGVLSILQGIAGIARDRLFGTPLHYEYRFDLTAWGWIHLVLGVALLAGGAALLRRVPWARSAGLAIAAISLISQFMFIPYYPVWCIAVMILDLLVLWTLARLAD
ncbi:MULTISPECIES: DUF7144 family membrane protein [Streptomyces]|uniref:DUF7144 domain-containing protein n=2 Tax=Streptomyces chilikensis TaxID=1194079 RepID=A0ABV3EKS7_9ACTN|nr:hypothetical protein [Streptomyces sp. MJP52]MDH6227790.1 hypothetical protein [Streptomyces sp. MJP52]